MRTARTIDELQISSIGPVGFVPTMGAFHEGHLELMRRSKLECAFTVVSLFVNPIQFGRGEDYSKYPRNFEDDARMAESVGVDLMFAPEIQEMYPNPMMTTVNVPEVGRRWEGEFRPGHFEGVATIVAKLFNIVRPDMAYFGRKDFQQCAVIRKMARDLNYQLSVSVQPTVREHDGLAMSSRNQYLSDEERKVAPMIFSTMSMCRDKMVNGVPVLNSLARSTELLTDSGFSVDYFAYVDDETLEPISELQSNSSLICAARIGNTRLIDNIPVI